MKTRALILFVALCGAVAYAGDSAKAIVKETSFHFRKVMRGAVVEHEFTIANTGTESLTIKNVVVSTPLRVLRLPAVIEPGSEATLKFSLDTTGVGNFYEGVIVVSTSDPSMREFQLTFDGDIVSTVEVSPMPAFYVASQQGET